MIFEQPFDDNFFLLLLLIKKIKRERWT